VSNLDYHEYRQCWGLTLGRYGDMQRELAFERNYPDGESTAVMLKDGERVVAWALVQPPENAVSGKNWAVELFTRPSERRKGYGTRLMRYVQYNYTPVQCWPHDDVSGRFFRNFENEIVCDKDSRAWIEGASI
jgi:GNAT superfamily N-acetyltransferase